MFSRLKKYRIKRGLHKLNNDQIPPFTLKDKKFDAKVISVHDGDTLTAIFYFNDNYYRFRIRLLYINAPELQSKIPEIKQYAVDAQRQLRDLTLSKFVRLECGDFDAFGRVLAIIYVNDLNVNEEMLKLPYVMPFKNKID